MKVILHTARLTLRPLCTGDVETAYAYLGDRENCLYMIFLPHDSKEETFDYLRKSEEEWQKESPGYYDFAVLLDGEHIGEVFVYLSGSLGEMGWIIHRDHRGQGYALEAAEALRDFALHKLKLKTLVAHCDARNIASGRIMQKLGMSLHERGIRQNRAFPGVDAEEVGYILENGEI